MQSFAVPAESELQAPAAGAELPAEPRSSEGAALFSYILLLRCRLRHLRLDSAFAVAAVPFLTREISNLRSAVSRHALCATCELLAKGWMQACEASVSSALLDVLLQKAVSDKSFLREAALRALRLWVQVEPSCRLLSGLCQLSSSKNRAIGSATAQLAQQ